MRPFGVISELPGVAGTNIKQNKIGEQNALKVTKLDDVMVTTVRVVKEGLFEEVTFESG